jgi:ribonuclease E
MMSADMLREEEQQVPRLEAQPPGAEGAREEGTGRRRRRRGGRGRGDRNAERAPREGFANEASPADAIETQAAELEAAREPAHESTDSSHRHERPHHEAREERVEQAAPMHEPVTPTHAQASATPVFAPVHAPVPFREVSQHDEAVEDNAAHRPNRKRRHGGEGESAQPELQLVETQVEAAAAPPADDDLPRRTKPRRRRSQAVDSEPLQIVETQPGAPSDGAQTP